MTKNIEEFLEQVKKHFLKSKNSILQMGITYKDQPSTYSFNNPNHHQHFGLGSISKVILSSYICEMIYNNEILIDKTIDYYLPFLKRNQYPTVLSLLTHTSGYYGFTPMFKTIKSLLCHGFNKKNIYKKIDRKWLINSIDKIRRHRKLKYRYSDYNYTIIALIIEHIKQKPYQTIIMEYLNHKIDMKDTYYGNIDNTRNDHLSWLWEEDNPFLASGGLFSTVDDMMKFAHYQITHQDRLKPAFEKYFKLGKKKNIYTGFSWNSFYNGAFFWHIGGQGNYRSYLLIDVKKEISIVILSTVDVNFQHVNRLGSCLYRNVKRNYSLVERYLQQNNI